MKTREKRPVYNGYEERYITGVEIKDLFKDEWIASGRHHAVVRGITVPEYLEYLLADDRVYRVFLNESFCKVMREDTDGEVVFFSHCKEDDFKRCNAPEKEDYNTICPKCGSKMKLKPSRYGEFVGCSNYPECKYKQNIPIIGNYIIQLDRSINPDTNQLL